MFGMKLKSWMETHLGRTRHKNHQNQKRAPKDSTGLACSSGSSANASISSTTNSTSSSSTNTTSSSSNASTTTAIVGGDGLAIAANNSNFCNNDTSGQHHHPEKSFNFSNSVTTNSSANVGALSSSSTAGSDPLTVSSGTTVEGQVLERKDGGGGGGSSGIAQQNCGAVGHGKPEIRGESGHNHQQSSITAPNCIGNGSDGGDCKTTVTTSASNSTSILSGSFSNSLSSPDTGYSTDGYSPKSVYPALSFDSGSSCSGGNTKSSSSTSKSSYTISSLASSGSELVHSSKQTTSSSLSSRTSCSIQNGLDEYASTAPSPSSPAALTSSTPFSQSTSSGISSGTSDSNCFPKGHQVHPHHHHHHHLESSLRLTQQKQQQHNNSLQQQHSIPEDDTEKQIIMGDGDSGEEKFKRNTGELTQEQKLLTGTSSSSSSSTRTTKTTSIAETLSSAIDPLAKFAQLSIDLKNQDVIASKQNVRTHRRVCSEDARTPGHEEYKPLVEDDDSHSHTGGEGNSSFGMTGSSQGKSIRTSFIINSSGQIVEFSSYKNAYSICSPRRERTRIKTNPWITIVNNKSSLVGGSSNIEGIPHANPVNNGSSEEESVDSKKMNLNNTSSSEPPPSSSSNPSKTPISYGGCSPLKSCSKSSNIVDFIDTRAQNEMNGWESVEKGNFARPSNNRGDIGNSDSVNVDPAFSARENLEINNKKGEEHEDDRDDHGVEEEHFVEDESGIIDHDSSSLLYRISTSASASDSGKGTLEPGTNRNSTESSCLLSDSTTASTRNSIISHEAEHSGSRSGRSSSGESISSSHKHHHHDRHEPLDDDTLGHASSPSSDTGAAAPLLFTTECQRQQQQHIHQSKTTAATVNSSMNTTVTTSSNLSDKGESSCNKAKSTSSAATITESAWGSDDQRTFRNAAVATDHAGISGFPKSSSVSVGVGTTGSNKSSKFHPVMVDKETDILSDWANTDEDADEDIETDRNDNETVTPAPSSPGTDGDRALFSQSTSSATDIDFGDSSAATQASSTAVFPPSSLVRHHRYSSNSSHSNINNSNKNAFNRGNGPKFHNSNNNNENNGFSNGGSGESGRGVEDDDDDDVAAGFPAGTVSQMLPGSYDHHQNHFTHQHNINMNFAGAQSYPSVPIIRPVLSAASQHHGPKGIPDSYAYDVSGDLSNHHSLLHTFHHPHVSSTNPMCFATGGVVPNFNLDDETDYPEMKESSSHHKGLARGALGFLRKIFKKGACSSQRHSPDSVKGKKSRGKSDNNLSTIGLGSPLLTISEPLSNPRYSAVLTTKKQMNPALNGYFLTPTPNSFRRRSGTGTDSSDSKSSKPLGNSKTVKTDIIRLPQGPLSPQLHQQQTLIQQHRQLTSSSHSSGSSCSSTNGGIPLPQQQQHHHHQQQQHACSTFLPPGLTNAHQLSGILPGENNLVMTTQSNTNTHNSSSTSSSIHSIMSTSTSAASAGINGNHNNRPPSQNQSHPPSAHRDANYYANSSPASRQSSSSSTSNGNNTNARGNRHSMSPPPLISENCSYLNEPKNSPHQPDFHPNGQLLHTSSRRESNNVHSQSPSIKGILPYESPRLSATARMSSPSFNNYSPIHRLVVTGGSHLLNKANSNNCPSGGNFSSSSGGPGLPMHYDGVSNNSSNPAGFPINTQIMNRPSTSNHPTAITSPSPLINHRYTATSTPVSHPYSSPMTSSQQQQGHFFASPSPILRNPRYQYITSSNQNSPVLNASKRMNVIPPSHSHLIPPSGSASNGLPSNPSGPPPLLTTFAPLPSSSSAIPLAPRESLMNSHSFNTNTITGSPNLNSSDPFNHRVRQVVSTSLSYNEFENLSRQQQHQNSYLFNNNCNNGNTTQHQLFLNSQQQLHQQHATPPNLLHQQQQRHAIPPQQQLLHQSQKSEIHHKNHYYSSAIVKGVQQEALHPGGMKTLWESRRDGRIMMSSAGNNNNDSARQYQQKMNQNLRFNSFLVRHRKLPQFYHTQWGLQERIYETVDSEDENSPSDEMSGGGGAGGDECEYDQDGNEIDCTSELSLPVEVHRRKLQQSFRQNEVDRTAFEERESRKENSEFLVDVQKSNDFGYREGSSLHNENHPQSFTNKKSKRSKPKSLSASGKPLPRPVVALPILPGTFLSQTETRLLESDKEYYQDRKYKKLINEAEALLKEISVEKSKRNGDGGRDNNSFRLEDCPQSDPLRRKAYDCWALRRLQQELAGCCASPPVLHRSRLNLQSPSTPTASTNPYLSHFQNLSTSQQPPLPHPEVSYMNTSGVDNNQNSFEF